MSFLKPNFNLCVFDVEPFQQSEVISNLLKRRFTELTPSQESGHGWVLINDLFKNNFEAENTHVVNYSTAGYRCDHKAVPPILIKKLYKEKLSKAIKEEGRVSKEQRNILKEECKIQLLSKALPNPKVFEWIWDFETNRIYLDTKSPKVIDNFMALFTDTFEVSLTLTDYRITEDALSGFLEWLWENIREKKGFWIYKDLTLDADKNIFKFNGPDLEDYLDEIENLKNTKRVQQLGISTPLNESSISFTLNDKNMVLSLKNSKKIKHDSVETAILDNGDIIKSVIKILENFSTEFRG